MSKLTPTSNTLYLFDFENIGNFQTVSSLILTLTGSDNLVITGTVLFVTGPTTTVSSVYAFGNATTDASNTTVKQTTVSDSFLTASWNDYTLECWMRPDDEFDSGILFNLPNGAGDSAITNFTGRWTLGNDMKFDYFSEYGDTGTDVNVAQTGSVYTRGVWQHVALVRRASGSNIACDFYKNGTLIETGVGAGQLPNTGSGTDDPSFAVTFKGEIYSLRFSNIARSGSEIQTSANRSDKTHTTDSNTVDHWLFTGNPTYLNRGTAPHHLTRTAGTAYNTMTMVSGVVSGVYHKACTLAGSPNYNNDVATIFVSESYTIDFWFEPTFNEDTQRFVNFAESGVESEAANFLFQLSYNGATRALNFFYEVDNGTDVSYTTTSSISSSERYLSKHIGWVVNKSPDFTQYYEVYFDGQLVENSSGSSYQRWTTGGDAGQMEFGPQADTYKIQNFRITRGRLSASEILDAYNTGKASSGGGSLPVVRLYRANVGSTTVYYRSDEVEPDGATNKVLVKEFIE